MKPMIARVYPLKRMSRKLGFFDYSVPAGMEVKRGDGVRIPFRSQKLFGVVAGITDKPERGVRLKPILAKVPELCLKEEELLFFEKTAFDLVQSVPALLYTCLPVPGSRPSARIKNGDLPFSTSPPDDSPSAAHISTANILKFRPECFVRVNDLKEVADMVRAFVQERPGRPVALIAPHVRDARLLAHALPNLAPLLMTGEESPARRSAAWQVFRKNERTLLIGTKLAIFLTHPQLDTVFIVRSSHADHKQFDRNPRYDTRQVARWLRATGPLRIVSMDVLPRVDDLTHLQDADRLGSYPDAGAVKMVAMNQERPTAAHPAFGSTTIAQIKSCLQTGKRVLCVNNHATEGSFGNRELAKTLQNFFPDASIGIVQKGHVEGAQTQIILASEFYFENVFDPFAAQPFGLVAMLDADQALRAPTFRAFERAAYHVEQWRALAHRARADFLLQTDEPELFHAYLCDPDARLKEELASRIAFGQPPARRWITIHFKGTDARESRIALHEVKRGILSLAPLSVCVHDELLQMGLRFEDVERVFAQLLRLNDAYIIDTTAFS